MSDIQIETYPDPAGEEIASRAFDTPLLRDELVFLRRKQIDAEKKGDSDTARQLKADQLSVLETRGSIASDLGLPEGDWAPADVVDDEVHDIWHGRIARNKALEGAAFDHANQPRYEALQGIWQEMLSKHRDAQQAYVQLYQMTSKMPQDQMTGLDLLAVRKLRQEIETKLHPEISDEDYHWIQSEISDINKQRQEQGLPLLQDDPRHQKWVDGLTLLVGIGGQAQFTKEGEYETGAIMRKEGPYEEGKEEFNLTSAATTIGLFGTRVWEQSLGLVDGAFRAGYNAANWFTGMEKPEAPHIWEALLGMKTATLDENGNIVYTGGRAPMPEEIAANLLGYGQTESELYESAAVRAELDSLPGMREAINGELMGAFYGGANISANLLTTLKLEMPAAGKVGQIAFQSRKLKAIETVENGMRGLAMLKAPGGIAAKIRKATEHLTSAVTFATMQGMKSGKLEDFGKGFKYGLGFYALNVFMGAMGDKFEKFLIKGMPNGPLWNAGKRGVRYLAEAAGLGAAGPVTGVSMSPLFEYNSEEGRLLRAFLANPSMESWELISEKVVPELIYDIGIPLLAGRRASKELRREAKAEQMARYPSPEVQAKITEPPERQARTTVPEKELPKYEQEGLELLLPDTALRSYRQMGEIVKAKGEMAKEAERRGHPFRPEKGIFADIGETIEVGVRGAKVVKTDRLMDRMIGVAQRSASAKGPRLETEFAVHIGRNPDTGEIYFGASKGEIRQVDMMPSMRRMRTAAKQHGVDVGDNTMGIHMHPRADPPSVQDIQTFEDFFWTNKRTSPQMIVGSQGAYAIEPIKPDREVPKPDEYADESVQKLREWLNSDKAEGTLRPDVLERLRGMSHEEMVQKIVGFEAGKVGTGQSLWGTLSRTSQLLSQKAWEQAGYRVGFFNADQAQSIVDHWAKTGKIDWTKEASPMDALAAAARPIKEYAAKRERERAAARELGEPEFMPSQPEIRDVNKEMTEAGRLEAVMKAPEPGEPRPRRISLEEEKAVWSKWVGDTNANYAESAAIFKKHAREITSSIAAGFGQYFSPNKAQRQAFRKRLADRIRAIGYGKKFLKLGPDENMVKVQTDVLRESVTRAGREVQIARADIFEPFLSNKELTNKQRNDEMNGMTEYAALRDLVANHIEQVRDPETGDVIKEIETPLPFDLSIEVIKERLAEVERSLNDRQRKAYDTWCKHRDNAFDSMVDRGLATESMRRKDYFPHHILDWDDAYPHQIGNRPKPKLPFRSSLMKRKGSKRPFDVSARAFQDYLLRVKVDNAKHDYLHNTSRRMQERLLEERGLQGLDFDQLDAKEWRALSEQFQDDGLVVIDIKMGRPGEQKHERNPLLHKMMSDLAVASKSPIIPEIVTGKNMRPGDGRYLVTNEFNTFLQESAISSLAGKIGDSRFLRVANKIIGKWVKGPALRGPLGLAIPARAARNLASDLHGIYLKGSGLRGVLGTLRNLPSARRIIHAYRTKDTNPEVVNKLSDYELSILQEMETRGTLQINVRGQEFQRDDPFEKEWLTKMMPETKDGLGRFLSQLYRADYKWAKAADEFSENIFRVGYFMRERFARFKQLQEMGMDAPKAELLAADDAHIEVGNTLINYQHLTPLERHGANGIAFLFYTWAKGNFTGVSAAFAEKPLVTSAKAVLAATPFVAWNLMVAKEEEERYWHTNPKMAAKPHLIFPWIRDEFGNPMVFSWDSTVGEALSFLGLDQLADDSMQMLTSHHDGRILAKDIAPGVFDNMTQAWKSFVAPWIREPLGAAWPSEFVTTGEKFEQFATKGLGQISRPWADLQTMAEWGKRERSAGERWTKYAPFIGYVDITKGVPGEQLPMHYEAGRIQRREAQLSLSIKNNQKRFVSGLKAGDADMMFRAVDRVWDEHGEQLQLLGVEKVHLLGRFLRGAEKRLREEALIESGGPFSPKWLQLSNTQKVEVLLRMMEQESIK